MVKCLILCHLGLGDNITMNGLCRYLCEYYDEVYFPSKEHNYNNVVSFFRDEPKIKIFIADDKILPLCPDIYKDCDVYNTSIIHKQDITIRNLSNIQLRDKDLEVYKGDNFLKKFYNRVNIPFKFYHEKIKLVPTENSLKLYEKVKNYNIIFIHENSSNKNFDILSQVSNLTSNDIVICSDKNYYNSSLNLNEVEKSKLAELFVNIPILDYMDTIINASKIMVSDSCFSAMIIPLKMNGTIKTDDITFFTREHRNSKIILELLPKVKCF